MKFQIITPERTVTSEEVTQITVPTTDGEITILNNHIPLVTVLKPGELRYLINGKEENLAVSGGFVEIKKDGQVIILADTAEHAREINLARAEEARAKAAALMSEKRHKERVDFETIETKLEKELARLRVGNKYRKLPPP